MPRRLRIEFEGAIYHVIARGNARQKIVGDDAERRRLTHGLQQAVVRHGWELLCYVIMGNLLHLLLKTPRPNLSAGMRSFLSGYAIWAGRRWRRQRFGGPCQAPVG
jgi:REP element-mobilizing transposase RayT